MFKRLGMSKVWEREDGVRIWLPCDKKTFRIVDRKGNFLSPRRFRTLEAAIASA